MQREIKKIPKVLTKTAPGYHSSKVVKGTVISVNRDEVLVDAGVNVASIIPVEQFTNQEGVITVNVGDLVDITIESLDDGMNETILSREKTKRLESLLRLEEAYEEKMVVSGVIKEKIKGGLTVEIDGIRAFLPGSLIDVRPVRDLSSLINKTLKFKVIKIDKKRNNIIVSRRDVINERASQLERQLIVNATEKHYLTPTFKRNFIDSGLVELNIENRYELSDLHLGHYSESSITFPLKLSIMLTEAISLESFENMLTELSKSMFFISFIDDNSTPENSEYISVEVTHLDSGSSLSFGHDIKAGIHSIRISPTYLDLIDPKSENNIADEKNEIIKSFSTNILIYGIIL